MLEVYPPFGERDHKNNPRMPCSSALITDSSPRRMCKVDHDP